MCEQTMPERKLPRLKNYDYSDNGCYFITICADNRRHLFSRIENASVQLTRIGRAAEVQLQNLTTRYPEISIEKYVIMPNHIHILMSIENRQDSKKHTISEVICAYKSLTTRQCREHNYRGVVFQKSFHDHIVRNQNDYELIWAYIDANPMNWEKDTFFAPDITATDAHTKREV